MSIIEVKNLSKSYMIHKKEVGLKGSFKNLFFREKVYKEAVKGISFSVEEGEIVGFLGPNGSGKTTTMKMLSGILYPTSGQANVLGYIPSEREVEYKKQFSIVMGQKNQLWWDLPANEAFDLIRTIYGINKKEYLNTLDNLVNLMDVKELIGVPVRNLSLGERMKMELIGALLYQPKVLFLDEPTIGLDFISRNKIQEFIITYNKEKKTTILLTSHYMQDIEKLCRKLIIINKGIIVFDGDINLLKKSYSDNKIIKLQCNDAVDADSFPKICDVISCEGVSINLRVKNENLGAVMDFIYKNHSVADVVIEDTPIEKIIERFYGI